MVFWGKRMTSTKKAHLQRLSFGAGQGVVKICGRLCTVFIQNIRRFSAALYSFAAILALLSPVFPCFCECLLKDVFSVDVIKRRMQSLGWKQRIYFMVPKTLSYSSFWSYQGFWRWDFLELFLSLWINTLIAGNVQAIRGTIILAREISRRKLHEIRNSIAYIYSRIIFIEISEWPRKPVFSFGW